ncbi:carbohydrate kinase family protein [Methylovirgula sp. 4M-Z18]|uniref:carbohydrate kinase family protein n=1 Tax=Methylovirgula sp. 4M-Z18 TaxID=2293567 RepID=UPI000E2FF371|nr:carbohydrate kinase family protein [Methylovirgula sp. 4M-Z18]RFB79712.1 carbohydrate kinase [Methylovirgula sp. 4M-Z18]
MPSPLHFILVGGASFDVKARAHAPPIRHTSNPGETHVTFGGVARNIAENLARLGQRVSLISALGRDPQGDAILAHAQELGIDCSQMLHSDQPTASYTAVLAPDGELDIAVSSFDILQALTPDEAEARARALPRADWIVADTNLAPLTLVALARLAQEQGARFALDPVSVAKAPRALAVLDARLPIALLTPNLQELAELGGTIMDRDSDFEAAKNRLHARGVTHLIMGAGHSGVFISEYAGDARRRHVPSLAVRALDVTGAGDAAFAGALYALAQGADLERAAKLGQAAAALTVMSRTSVSDKITPDALEDMLNRGPESP